MYLANTNQKMTKRSVVYAFLPVGSKPTDLRKYVRIGHHASKHTDGSRARLGTRFNGLNSVREVLLMIEVDRPEVPRVYDFLRMQIMGPGRLNGVNLQFQKTFRNAWELGTSWFETKLPLADVRAVFYEIADRICGGAIDHAKAQSLQNHGDRQPPATEATTAETVLVAASL